MTRRKRRHYIPIAVLLACVGAPIASFAHSKMSKSEPAEGATAKAGLSEIKLGFSKPVRVMLVKVKDAATNAKVDSVFKPAVTYATTFDFKVTPLQPGRYQVNWSAIARDGHIMTGKLSFKIAK